MVRLGSVGAGSRLAEPRGAGPALCIGELHASQCCLSLLVEPGPRPLALLLRLLRLPCRRAHWRVPL